MRIQPGVYLVLNCRHKHHPSNVPMRNGFQRHCAATSNQSHSPAQGSVSIDVVCLLLLQLQEYGSAESGADPASDHGSDSNADPDADSNSDTDADASSKTSTESVIAILEVRLHTLWRP
jgi:hypothetical protein